MIFDVPGSAPHRYPVGITVRRVREQILGADGPHLRAEQRGRVQSDYGALGEMPGRSRSGTGKVAPDISCTTLAGFCLNGAAENVDPAPGVARIVGVVAERRGAEVARLPPADREAAARMRPEETPHVEIFHPVSAVHPVLRRALTEGEHQEPAPVAAGCVRAAVKQPFEHGQHELREALQVLIGDGLITARGTVTRHRFVPALHPDSGDRIGLPLDNPSLSVASSDQQSEDRSGSEFHQHPQ